MLKRHLTSAALGLFALSVHAAPLPRTVLFVDDADVLYRSGTKRQLEPLKKFPGNPVIASDKLWEGMIGWVSTYRNPETGKFQMWYQAYSEKRSGDRAMRCVVAYAESDDGITWTKPNLGLFPFYEVKDTNIVLIGTTGAYGDRYCNSVLVDPKDPDPARRYKMIYADWSEEGAVVSAGLRMAFSPDGIRWTKSQEPSPALLSFGAKGQQMPYEDESPHFDGPVKKGVAAKNYLIPLSMSDAVDVIYDHLKDRYVCYGKMWIEGPEGGSHWKHGMGRIESADFRNWSEPEYILGPDDRDAPLTEFHTSPVFLHNDQYFCLNQILDRVKGVIDIELMSSRDGLAWERPFIGIPFLERGTGTEFDAGSIFTNSTPIFVGDEMRFYYGAYRASAIGAVNSNSQEIGSKDYFSGIGFASMKRDRFAAIIPDPAVSAVNVRKPTKATIGKAAPTPTKANAIGQITLKPIDLSGIQEITINADASKGSVRVEILNEDGYRVRGFTKEDAVPIQGNAINLKAEWKDKSVKDLTPKKYIVRLHLDNAKLYACTLK